MKVTEEITEGIKKIQLVPCGHVKKIRENRVSRLAIELTPLQRKRKVHLGNHGDKDLRGYELTAFNRRSMSNGKNRGNFTN